MENIVKLYDQLLQDLMDARKAKRQVEVMTLSTVIGELQNSDVRAVKNESGRFVKIIGDPIVVSVLKKFIKNLETNIELKPDEKMTIERDFLLAYIPQQMTENQLNDVVAGFETIGDFMSHLKANYSGRYDGKLASKVFKDSRTRDN